MKKKTCKIEGCKGGIWSKNLCSYHFKIEFPPKPIKKISEKGKIKKEEKKKWFIELHQFYIDLWDKRADKNGNVKCFETGVLMSHTVYKYNLCCYSHQIPKSQRPDLALNEDNILLVLPDIHSQWEADPTKCPNMYKYTEKLKKQYGK